MPSSDEIKLKGQLEEKEKELQELRLALRSRDKQITDLKRKLERAQRLIGNEAVELPEKIGRITERLTRLEHEYSRMKKLVENVTHLARTTPSIRNNMDADLVLGGQECLTCTYCSLSFQGTAEEALGVGWVSVDAAWVCRKHLDSKGHLWGDGPATKPVICLRCNAAPSTGVGMCAGDVAQESS